MQSRVRFLGHPIHQMLVVFPLGLLAAAVVFDLVFRVSAQPEMALVAYWMTVSGVVGGALAAPFGWLDWAAIPKGTRAKSVGLVHGTGNAIILLLFVASWILRQPEPAAPPLAATVAAVVGASMSLVTAWLGGELVNRLAIGVYEDAHPDASSSLRAR